MCNSEEIENEFNFLIVYPAFNDYRANLFKSITLSHEFNIMTMEEKFIFIKMCQKIKGKINVMSLHMLMYFRIMTMYRPLYQQLI